jgi:hypothetical protein
MKPTTRLALIWALLLDGGLASLARGDDPATFDRSVAPILARRCLDCHSGTDPKGKLDLSRRDLAFQGGQDGPAITPARLDQSSLWERIVSDEMPPKTPLNDEEKHAIRTWIEAGARWGTDPIDPYQATTSKRAGRDWWSLQPVRRVEPPTVNRADWPRSPLDRFVLRRLESEGLAPRAEADRVTLIRRLRYDLTGLPPTPEEVEEFLNDLAPNAYEKLVDRLLASPDHGVRWARWWLDLARFGESNGFEYDEFRPGAYRYRDWVVDSLNRDLPYDQFARLQIAGDILKPDDPGAVEATGFLVAGSFDTVGQNQISQVMKAVVRSDELEDIIGTVSQTFLGLTVNCARCHDHKFDPIRQTDYYRFASALDGVRHGERDLSGIDPESVSSRSRVEEIAARIRAIQAPVLEKLLARHRDNPAPAPTPVAAWDFDRGLADRVGSLKIALRGGATIGPEGLHVDGRTGFAETAALPFALKAKTLEAWVKLDNLDQRGGGIFSLQRLDGGTFDAIVFGELEPARWMAGSEGFVRSKSVGGAAEIEATKRPIHVALTTAVEGTTRLYRDGQPYGNPYGSGGVVGFASGESRIAFGLRHYPAGGNKMLAGTIVRARLYDRVLEPAEVAATAAASGNFVSPKEVADALSDEERAEVTRLTSEIDRLRAGISAKPRKVYSVVPREPGVMKVQLRGNPAEPGEVVSAGGISSLASTSFDFGLASDAPEGERRRRLAGWITDPKNPLFSRVVVNRLWQAHFGSGLVETSSDLGFSGGLPSHPELLDWLASELPARGWSLKAMHRLIVTSATYRQGSQLDPAAMAKDSSGSATRCWRPPGGSTGQSADPALSIGS